MIYTKIIDFCSVRNAGNCYKNGQEPTPRVKFLMKLLESEGIEYELDTFEEEEKPISSYRNTYKSYYPSLFRRKKNRKYDDVDMDLDLDDDYYKDTPWWERDYDDYVPPVKVKNNYFNIILKGTSDRMVVAHHDIQNPRIDNANDNSCSVINAIALKKLRPEINVVLLDGEEMGGIGSAQLSKQINAGKFGKIDWVLNLELSGKGGKYFFIGDYPGKLTDRIKTMFNCPVAHTPFNDSVTLRRYGIDSVVINPLPPLPEGQTSIIQFHDGKYLDYKMLFHCHNEKDNLASVSVADMKEFVEEVLVKIVS